LANQRLKSLYKPPNCPQCNGTLVFPDGLNGEIVCTTCGLVKSRTTISQGFTEWTPKWHYNWDEEDSDTMREWLTTLRTISCRLNVPNFPYREEAARIIRLRNTVLFRSQRFGKNKAEAVAALIHLILKKYNEIRPLKEICNTLSLDERLVTKYEWTIRKMTNLQRTLSPRDYLRKYGSELTLDSELLQKADQLLVNLRREISGNPISLAAAALYFVCQSRKMNVSKDKIGQAFHISNRTVYSNERKISRLISAKGLRVGI